MRTLTRKQALKEGYVIDDYAARGPIGYKGPRFGPDCQWVPVLSEREEKLYALVKTICEQSDVSCGVCCCGDDMARHADPMSCGHTPVDMLAYHVHGVLTELNIEGEV